MYVNMKGLEEEAPSNIHASSGIECPGLISSAFQLKDNSRRIGHPTSDKFSS